MAIIAAIVVNDGASTPAPHTFNPVATSPKAMYREGISNLPLVGQGQVMIGTGVPGAAVQRVKLTLALPALETATGANSDGYTAAPKVAYTNTVQVEFLLPSRGTAQQRKDLRVMLSNLLLNAQVVDSVDNLNAPY